MAYFQDLIKRSSFIFSVEFCFVAIVIAKEIHLEIFLPVNHHVLHQNCSIAQVSSLAQVPSPPL
jgi:hypothetical protein